MKCWLRHCYSCLVVITARYRNDVTMTYLTCFFEILTTWNFSASKMFWPLLVATRPNRRIGLTLSSSTRCSIVTVALQLQRTAFELWAWDRQTDGQTDGPTTASLNVPHFVGGGHNNTPRKGCSVYWSSAVFTAFTIVIILGPHSYWLTINQWITVRFIFQHITIVVE